MSDLPPDAARRPWWRSVIYWYFKDWKGLVGSWLVVAVIALVAWQYTIFPVKYDGVETPATMTWISCGRSGYAYTYAYEVSGVHYVGKSSSGDGNVLDCHLPHKPQSGVATYSAASPGKSIGGTLSGRRDDVEGFLTFIPPFSFLLWGPICFARELGERRRRKEKLSRDPQWDARNAPPLRESRQQRRARERHANK